MPIKSVSFASQTPDAQMYQIQQAQQLAQMLQQGANDPIQSALPTAPIAASQGLDKLLKAFLAGQQRRKVADMLEQHDQGIQGANASLRNLLMPPHDTQVAPLGDEPGFTVHGPSVDPKADMLGQALSGLGPSGENQFLSQIAAQRLFPPPDEYFSAAAGSDIANKRTGAVVGHVPDRDRPENQVTMNVVMKDDPKQTKLSIWRRDFNPDTMVEWTAPPNNLVVPMVEDDGKTHLNLISPRSGDMVKPDVGSRPTAGAGGSARMKVFNDRVFTNAKEATASMHNIVNSPVTASTGWLGSGNAHPTSLLATSLAGLRNTMTPQEMQTYNTKLMGLGRNLAVVESGGLQVNQAFLNSFESAKANPGDTNITKLHKLAEVRQIVDQAMDVKLASPDVPDDQKNMLREMLADLHSSIPFSHDDIDRLEQSGKSDMKMSDFIKAQNLPQQGYSDPKKERRYQDWKAAHPNG